MVGTASATLRRAVLALLLAAALAVAALPGDAARAATPDCPTVMPVADVRDGMVGTGLTVSDGVDPQPFSVEVLGVLANGIAPGKDLIVVRTSGPALDAARGIWAGMSGSPVTVDGKLIGAIAYGFSAGPSKIGGITPAEYMLQVVGYDTAPEQPAARWAKRVPVTDRALRRELAALSGRSYADAGELSQLRVPLSISGLGAHGMDRLRTSLSDARLPFVAVAGSASTTVPGPAPAAARPGDNFAGVLSYGDLTAAGIGTTTFTCDGEIAAFGHPFFFSGEQHMGANAAEALAVIDDPTFGPYKLANVGGTLGVVDQDRLAAISGTLGDGPATIPVVATVHDTDTASTRTGRTDVVSPDAVVDLAPFHLLANIDVVMDRIGAGTSSLVWTITGDRSDGPSFTLQRGDLFASDFDISYESTFELYENLFALAFNGDEEITFTGVSVDAETSAQVRRYTFDQIDISLDGGETYLEPAFGIPVQPGDVLTVRVPLDPGPGEDDTTAVLDVVVPEDAFGYGILDVVGGRGFAFEDPCLFDPAACGGGEGVSVDQLIADLETAPTNDQLTATVQFFDQPILEPSPEPAPEPGGTATPAAPAPSDEPTATAPPASASTTLDRVVQGQVTTELFVEGSEQIRRLAGGSRVATSASVSLAGFPDGAQTVVLARADDYPDALAGAPLAASLGAPVLLTDGDALSPEAAEEVARLGSTSAVLLGGTGALSVQVEDDLGDLGVESVVRYAGTDRFDTARMIADEIGGSHAYVAKGADADPSKGWPDALAASALAAFELAPILLTESGALPDATASAFGEGGFTSATVVGGTAAVATDVEAALEDAGAEVDRVAGATRYETSVLLAERATQAGALALDTWMATGRDWPDALAAGPAAALSGGVLVLVDGQSLDSSPPAAGWVDSLAFSGARITFVGGYEAITEEVEFAVIDRLFGGGIVPVGEPVPAGSDGGPGSEPPPGGEPYPTPTEEPPQGQGWPDGDPHTP